MQELVELRGIDTGHGLLAGDQALLDHFDGDTQGGGGGALAHAGLEHPELALLDGELDIAHIAVMGSVLRMPATTSSPWALTKKSP